MKTRIRNRFGLWAVILGLTAGCSPQQPNENQGQRANSPSAQERPASPTSRVVDSLLSTPNAQERMMLSAQHLQFRPLTLPGPDFDSIAALHALLPGLLAQISEDEDAEPPVDAAAWVVWGLEPSQRLISRLHTDSGEEDTVFGFSQNPNSSTPNLFYTDIQAVFRFVENGAKICRVVLRTLENTPNYRGANSSVAGRETDAFLGLADFKLAAGNWVLMAYTPNVAAWGQFGSLGSIAALNAPGLGQLVVAKPKWCYPGGNCFGAFLLFNRQGTGFSEVLYLPLTTRETTPASSNERVRHFWSTRLFPITASSIPTLQLETTGKWNPAGLSESNRVPNTLPRSLLVHAAQHDSFAFTLHREFRWTGQRFELAKEVLETR